MRCDSEGKDSAWQFNNQVTDNSCMKNTQIPNLGKTV
jgi:hypothetical protein